MRSKYQPLTDYLATQPSDTVTLTFAEIEAMLGSRLPHTAHRPGWWSNSPTWFPHARTWLGVGWRVKTANLAWRTVTFVRQPSGRTEAWSPPST